MRLTKEVSKDPEGVVVHIVAPLLTLWGDSYPSLTPESASVTWSCRMGAKTSEQSASYNRLDVIFRTRALTTLANNELL